MPLGIIIIAMLNFFISLKTKPEWFFGYEHPKLVLLGSSQITVSSPNKEFFKRT